MTDYLDTKNNNNLVEVRNRRPRREMRKGGKTKQNKSKRRERMLDLVFTSLGARSRLFSHLIRGFGEARHYFRRRM